MQYREFLPHPALRSVVECYWCVQGNSTGFWMVYPDACMDILFNFGSYIETRSDEGNVLSKNRAFIIGNMFNVYDLSREVGISQKQMERKFVEKVGSMRASRPRNTPKHCGLSKKYKRSNRLAGHL